MMALLPVAAVLSLTLWICLTFLFPLGPAGSAVHLPPGAGRSAVCEVVGAAGEGRREKGEGKCVRGEKREGIAFPVSLLLSPSSFSLVLQSNLPV
jgi:hypothetical protein